MLSNVKSFVIAFAAGILIFGLIGYLLVPQLKTLTDGFFTPGNPEEESDVTYEIPPVPDESGTVIKNKAVFEDHKSFTILLIGSDYQPDVFSDYRISVQGSSDANQLATHQRHYKADVITLIRYSAESGIVMFSAIPPNLMVTASGVQMKLGAVLERKGAEALTNIVEGVVGMDIDYYICCRISLFANIINRIGGVKFDVPRDMYYVNEEERILSSGSSRDPIPLVVDGQQILDSEGNPVMIPAGRAFTINLKRGMQDLNGEKATWLLRYNAYDGGFSERRDTIANFFRALFDTVMKEENNSLVSGIIALINSSNAGETNMSQSDFEELAETMLSYEKYEKSTVIFPCIVNGTDIDETVTASKSSAYSAYERYKLQ